MEHKLVCSNNALVHKRVARCISVTIANSFPPFMPPQLLLMRWADEILRNSTWNDPICTHLCMLAGGLFGFFSSGHEINIIFALQTIYLTRQQQPPSTTARSSFEQNKSILQWPNPRTILLVFIYFYIRLNINPSGQGMGRRKETAAGQQANPRQPLRDTSNFGGSLNARNAVDRNEGNPEYANIPCSAVAIAIYVEAQPGTSRNDGALTRTYSAAFSDNQHWAQDASTSEELDENMQRRVKQRTIMPSTGTNQTQNSILDDTSALQSDYNIIQVWDYAEEFYNVLLEKEMQGSADPNYMSAQSYINANTRATLIDWLIEVLPFIEVHHRFSLRPQTLFLTVNIIDRYLSKRRILKRNLQLVGVTAMIVACKFEEILIPMVSDFMAICDDAYSGEQVLEMEKLILVVLQFNLTVPTPLLFIHMFLNVADSDRELTSTALFLMELCLVEYSAVSYRPSMLAAAALYTARCILQRQPFWNSTLECQTNYTESALGACAKMIAVIHAQARKSQFKAVFDKYKTPDFCCAAMLEPAHQEDQRLGSVNGVDHKRQSKP
eukprot:Gb_09901 [translate_table: standard]